MAQEIGFHVEAGPSVFNGSLDFIPFDFDEADDTGKEEARVDFERSSSNAHSSTRNERHLSPSRHHEKDSHERRKGVGDFTSGSRKRKTMGDQVRDNQRPPPGGNEYKTPAMRKRERRQMASTTPWCENVDFDRCSNATEMLHDELIAFADWMSPTPKEHEVRQMVIQLIRRAIVKEWPDAAVEAFGSQNTQLYMPHGDIDLVVVSDSMEAQRREHVLRKMAAILRRNNLATDVQVIAKAKVPIVKFVCTQGRLKVDISVNQTNGIHASHFVNDWLAKCPPLRPLIMVTKLFLSQRGLSEVFSGGLGSYSVICMVINHIQLHPKVQRGELNPALNLGILFLDFLELFGKNFGYDNVGITVCANGGYFAKGSRGWRDERRPFMLSIEDPLDSSNDISKGSFGIIQVRSALGGAFDILTATICQRANEQRQRNARQHWQDEKSEGHSRDEDEEARRALLDGARNPGEANKDPKSVLGAIVGVSRDMMKYKRELEQLWQSGALQHKLGRSPPGRSPEPMSGTVTPYEEERSDDSIRAKRQRAESNGEARHSGRVKTNDVDRANPTAKGVGPIVVHDESGRATNGHVRDADEDGSSVIMNEEELAASQGFHFSSLSSSAQEQDSPVSPQEREDDDSRYTSTTNMQKPNGTSSVKLEDRIGSRLDAFAEHAPQAFVDDDDDDYDDAGSSPASDQDPKGYEAKHIAKRNDSAARSSSDAKARRERKNAFWATKGNAVNKGAISPDDGLASVDDENEDGDEGVMLNIYE